MIKPSRIALMLLLFALFSCGTDSHKTKGRSQELSNDDFVSIVDDHFVLHGEEFNPIIMNYIVGFQILNNKLVLGPTIEYDLIEVHEGETEEEVYDRVRAHFQTIKDMGFNTIRIMELHKMNYLEFFPSGAYKYHNREIPLKEQLQSPVFIKIDDRKEEILESIQKVVEIAEKLDLKLLMTLPRPRSQNVLDEIRLNFIEDLIDHFKDNPTVFAYDFFNEPLYFDNSEYSQYYEVLRTKQSAYDLVKSWKNMMLRIGSPQLLTISFAEPIEVFEWDASLLPVDFVSIHSYNPLRIKNELYWYAKYLDKPWLISETALPADGDSISYEEQAQFMHEVLKIAEDAGSLGFGWWQYQEVWWGHVEHNHTSLLDHKREFRNSVNDRILGSMKPAANIMKEHYYKRNDGALEQPINYYNMLGYDNYLVEGRVITIVDNDTIGVEGAVVRGYPVNWNTGINTYTDKDGYYNLYSNDSLAHFEVSAFGLTDVKRDLHLNYELVDQNKQVSKRELRYETVFFKDYLLPYDSLNLELIPYQRPIIFNFDSTKFNRSKYRAKMSEFVLDSVHIHY